MKNSIGIHVKRNASYGILGKIIKYFVGKCQRNSK